jgi:16S rRNA (cytidine1402-2'-O)-methyltransferase
MPLVSDPGATLVREARKAGIPIQVVPGPSAVTAVLAAGGVSGPFAFLGFPPAGGKERKAWLDRIGQTTALVPTVFFEAPHKVARTMAQIAAKLGNRPIAAGRELTKSHETLVEQPILAWIAENASGAESRGEHVIIVMPPSDGEAHVNGPPSDEELAREIGRMIENDGLRPKQAAKALAAKYGLSATALYALHAKHNR